MISKTRDPTPQLQFRWRWGGSFVSRSRISHRKSGNYHALLNVVAEHDAVLKEHLEHPALKNCMYTSPKIQNDIINIIGKDIIQKSIIEDVSNLRRVVTGSI